MPLEARDIYRSRDAPGLRGLMARVLSFVYLHARPPPVSDTQAADSEAFDHHLGGQGRVLLLGSNLAPGAVHDRGYTQVVQLDIQSHEHVDVVADAEEMAAMLGPASFDYVVSTSMLEHTHHPWLVFEQVFEVLRPGGLFYVEAPWMFPLHGEPHDFFRFSAGGLRNLAEDAGFEVLEAGSRTSGHGALYVFLRSYLSETLSLDRTVLYYVWEWVWTWLLYPLLLLERCASMRDRANRYTDSLVYLVGRKPGDLA